MVSRAKRARRRGVLHFRVVPCNRPQTLLAWLERVGPLRLGHGPIASADAALALAEFGWDALLFATPATLLDSAGRPLSGVADARVPWAATVAFRAERVDGIPALPSSSVPAGTPAASVHTPENWLLVESLVRRAAPHLHQGPPPAGEGPSLRVRLATASGPTTFTA